MLKPSGIDELDLQFKLGTTPDAVSGFQRYYIESGNLHWGAIKECKPTCRKNSFLGHGDNHFIPTGVDLRWKAVREAESKSLIGLRRGCDLSSSDSNRLNRCFPSGLIMSTGFRR